MACHASGHPDRARRRDLARRGRRARRGQAVRRRLRGAPTSTSRRASPSARQDRQGRRHMSIDGGTGGDSRPVPRSRRDQRRPRDDPRLGRRDARLKVRRTRTRPRTRRRPSSSARGGIGRTEHCSMEGSARLSACRCGRTRTIRATRMARRFGPQGIGLCRTRHMFFEPDAAIVQKMILAVHRRDSPRSCCRFSRPTSRDLRSHGGLPVRCG